MNLQKTLVLQGHSANHVPKRRKSSGKCGLKGKLPNDVRIAEWVIEEPPKMPKEKSIVAEIWHQYIPDVVPFDPVERKKLRDRVYPDLKQFIDHWESRLSKAKSEE